jgi:hypothetical protein
VPSFELIDEISYVIPLEHKARELFRRIETGEPLGGLGKILTQTEASPANITTQVLAAGSADDAADAEQTLRGAGFVVLGTRDAPAGLKRTQIIFGTNAEQLARVVAGYFPETPAREGPRRLLGEANVVVVVGPDYRSLG